MGYIKCYKDVVANASNYLAIGEKEVYLDGGLEELPWSLVTRCEPGGTHRIDISTSVWFYAKHESGLNLRWSFDIEPDTADGKGYYEIDVASCRRVLGLLNGCALSKFREYLAECVTKVRERGNTYQKYADKMYGDAAILQDLVNYETRKTEKRKRK